MTDGADPQASGGEASSIALVLKGEKAADARLAEGRREADRIRQAGLAEGRRISSRADQRIQALHGSVQAKIAADKARMVEAFEEERQELATRPGADEIAAAAMRLARRILGLDKS
ncbi:hypothetical protein [Ostreiculturibacter nitratireducens]|uniref:hypothetical protein n=1 Tax=Ostreiculturibacter nitratireducens TaxID=3075226 RepID=UPI0031B5A3FB